MNKPRTHLKRIIIEASSTPYLEEGEDYWLCEDCIDGNSVEGDVIDQGVELRECVICGADS